MIDMPAETASRNQKSVLVVDDEKGIRQMLYFMLSKSGYDVLEASDGEIAMNILKENTVDLVISDVMMPNMDGFDLCQFIKYDSRLRDVYIILLTAKNSLNDKVAGLNVGADDFLSKPFHTEELVARVNAGFRLIDIQKELKRINRELDQKNRELDQKNRELDKKNEELAQKNEQISQAAKMDALTQVYNRQYYDEIISIEVTRSLRYKNHLTMIMLDIDHFKGFNDIFTHHIGDEVLITVAGILKESTREIDLVARYGGEEFIVILRETKLENGMMVAEKLRTRIESDTTHRTHLQNLLKADPKIQANREEYIRRNPSLADRDFTRITISAGVASFQEHGCANEKELFDKADRALMHYAKVQGRNRVIAYPLS